MSTTGICNAWPLKSGNPLKKKKKLESVSRHCPGIRVLSHFVRNADLVGYIMKMVYPERLLLVIGNKLQTLLTATFLVCRADRTCSIPSLVF